MTMIDCHQHFWTRGRGDYTWLTEDLGPIYQDFGPDDLLPLMVPTGVTRTVLVQAAATVAETRFMLSIADRNNFVAGVVGWVDFEAPDAPRIIAGLARHPKLKGLRPMIQDIEDDDWMLRPDLDPAFRALIDYGLCFDALVFPRHLKNLITLLGRYPDLRAVTDHAAKPRIGDGAFDDWAADMTELAGATQTLCKISGMITEDGPGWSVERLKPYVDHLLRIFGPSRLMWGSDWPVLNLVGDYEGWHAAARELLSGLSKAGRDAVFGGNAARFYGL